MKAITIWQPWASLLVMGAKLYETRSWATNYCGPIAIHAAAKPVQRTIDELVRGTIAATVDDLDDSYRRTLERFDRLFPSPAELYQLPTGAIIGTARLVRCNPIDEAFVARLTEQEIDLGDYSPGRFAWEFESMTPLPEPIPAKGTQGLWKWKGGVANEIPQSKNRGSI